MADFETDSKLLDAFREIQMPRTPFVLEHFIANQHYTPATRYAQVTLELQNKYYAVKRAQITRQETLEQIAKLRRRRWWWPFGQIKRNRDADVMALDLEQTDLAVIGAVREAEVLYQMWRKFDHVFTREELNADQVEYWRRRLTAQAQRDVNASGRVSVSNQEALEQIGLATIPQRDCIREVEQRYLESGNAKVLIAVPTLIPRETIAEEGLRCLEGWSIPGSIQQKRFVVDGRPVADAYTEAAMQAVQDNADFVLCVEDDIIPPVDAFDRLYQLWQSSGPKTIVGAWYPIRSEPRRGTPIILRDGKRQHLEDDGDVHDVYTVPQGFTLIPTSVFLQAPQPWFATTGTMTQDSFFSQVAREAGYRLIVDTSVRCQHVDRETGKVFL